MLFRPNEAGFSSFGASNVCDVSTNIQQAKFMLYTLHIAPDSLTNKLGCGLLLRRGSQEYSLLPYLVETKKNPGTSFGLADRSSFASECEDGQEYNCCFEDSQAVG